jgi:hemoglobin-like flavoprotein
MKQLDSSYATLRAGIAAHPEAFYEALFRHAPELRSLFREDLEGQGMKFMTTLGVILARLRDSDAVDAQFKELGSKHAALGVSAAHFAPMEEALMETLGKELGTAFTPELETLWRRAFQAMAARMIRRGGISG